MEGKSKLPVLFLCVNVTIYDIRNLLLDFNLKFAS